jgi:hypothetical protein
MSILDNAMKHFSESADHELHKIDVPEWEDVIWFKAIQGMTGAEYQRYSSTVRTQDYSSMVDALILRARKEDGLKMFTPNDKKKLMGPVDPDVIISIFTKMTSIDNEVAEEVKKS